MATNTKTFKDFFAPAFWRPWNDVVSRKVSTVTCSGGRGSCKSSFIATAIILLIEQNRREILEMRNKGVKDWQRHVKHAACFRKIGGTLADSCFSQFQWSIEKLGLGDRYVFRKTPLSIVRTGTNQRIYFRGLDDPMKARSLKAPVGYISFFWGEELSEFDNYEEIQDVVRSVQRGGSDFLTFFSYNPPETSSNWVNYCMAQQEANDPTFRFYKSNYRTVPTTWLGDKFFRDAEILRRINERAYRHVYLGEITGNGGTVFPNVRAVTIGDADIKRFDKVKWGADFGLRDPTVLLGCNYDSSNHRLIIFDEVYKPDMTLDEILTEFSAHHFGFEYIIGDNNAAQLIVSLRQKGLQILPCEKGNGSILNGTKWLQSLTTIDIDPRRCPNTYREFVNYEYEKNKAGEFTGRLPPGNDHSVDACRYAVERLSKYNSAFS